MMLGDNYIKVMENIKAACKRAGRDESEVTLISVSKTKPVSDIEEVYKAGSRDFGENKVQEILEKTPVLPDDINWHMIGHLQTNKVKQVIDKTVLIHSVDSLHLAKEIEKQAAKKDIIVNILLEVNVAKEDSKFGLYDNESVYELAEECAKMPHLKVQGLMTIAPYTDNPDSNRPYFKKLKELSVDIMRKNIDNISMDVLSMGMTGDYEVAIEEGATMVRVGTGIFGERNYAI